MVNFMNKKIIINFVLFIFLSACSNDTKKDFDVIISNGNVYDGLGNEPLNTDIGIINDSVAQIGNLDNFSTKKFIDATDMVVAPGFINIDETSNPGRGKYRNDFLSSKIPVNRLGQPEEIGKTVKWLISKDSDYISGQVIVVDGGFQNSGSRGEAF